MAEIFLLTKLPGEGGRFCREVDVPGAVQGFHVAGCAGEGEVVLPAGDDDGVCAGAGKSGVEIVHFIDAYNDIAGVDKWGVIAGEEGAVADDADAPRAGGEKAPEVGVGAEVFQKEEIFFGIDLQGAGGCVGDGAGGI